jgi:hypothetical protein
MLFQCTVYGESGENGENGEVMFCLSQQGIKRVHLPDSVSSSRDVGDWGGGSGITISQIRRFKEKKQS